MSLADHHEFAVLTVDRPWDFPDGPQYYIGFYIVHVESPLTWFRLYSICAAVTPSGRFHIVCRYHGTGLLINGYIPKTSAEEALTATCFQSCQTETAICG